jgi:uncharacterized Fe-S cluster protein YjdI
MEDIFSIDDIILTYIKYRVTTVRGNSSLFKLDSSGDWIHITDYPDTDNHMEIILDVCPDASIVEYDKKNQESLWQVR